MIRQSAIIASLLIAQMETPSAEGFHSWMTSAVAVLGVVWLAIQIYQSLKKPDRNPPIEAEFATNEDLKEHERSDNDQHNNLFKKMGGVERGTNQQLTKLTAQVAALDERTETTNATVAVLSQKFDTLIMELRRDKK